MNKWIIISISLLLILASVMFMELMGESVMDALLGYFIVLLTGVGFGSLIVRND